MYYPEEIVEEVRTRNDIVDVISGYVKLQKKGSNYFGLCPFHNEKSPSFSVSPQKQMYYCFGCGAGGNVITFVMEYENYTFPEALKVLADRAGIKLPEVEYTKEERARVDKRSTLLEINKLAANYFYYQLQSISWRPTIFIISFTSLRERSVMIILKGGNCLMRRFVGLAWDLPIKPAMTCISICVPRAMETVF